jgi:hypothetical protein
MSCSTAPATRWKPQARSAAWRRILGARAVPGLLGCIEASLDEPAAASATLQRGEVVDAAADARRRRGLGNLRVALTDAAAAAQAARAPTARMLTRSARDSRSPSVPP